MKSTHLVERVLIVATVILIVIIVVRVVFQGDVTMRTYSRNTRHNCHYYMRLLRTEFSTMDYWTLILSLSALLAVLCCRRCADDHPQADLAYVVIACLMAVTMIDELRTPDSPNDK